MSISIKTIRFLLVLTLPVFISTCSECSPSGVVGAVLISDKDEAELGAEFHFQLKNDADKKLEYPILNPGTNIQKQNLKAYLDSVFQSVMNSIPSKDMPDYEFTFTIIDKDVANAFAVPGGYVYIYTGIVKEMLSESELAGVIGHEIAHVTLHHYRRTATKQAMVGTILNAIAGKEAGALTELVLGSFGFLAAQYVSRDFEYEADARGTDYLFLSGRHPRGIADFFSRMDENFGYLEPVVEATSTHPLSSERVSAVDEIIKKAEDYNYSSQEQDALKYVTRFTDAKALVP